MSRLRVCIDARVGDGRVGGVEQVVLGLATGLSKLEDGDEEYLFLADDGAARWLPRYVSGPCRVVTAGRRGRPLTERLWRLWTRDGVRPPPRSNGLVEGTGASVVHFVSQKALLTDVPSIYHPHDLQHVHLPQFFTEEQRRQREKHYRAFCEQAAVVAVGTSWTRDDVARHFGLAPEKLAVVPLAPPNDAYRRVAPAEAASLLAPLGLPERFVFYPAQTWPHKNHLALLDALASLRREGLVVPLVCSGKLTEHHARITEHAAELGIAQDVRFLGFVSPDQLAALYARCAAVVIPTLFEAASFPLWEAFLAGAPAACSNVTSLPRQAGDAALVFDPGDIPAMGAAVLRLWSDAPLREELARRGRERVASLTWERTARHFRALYRRVAGAALTPEDRAVLEDEPVL